MHLIVALANWGFLSNCQVITLLRIAWKYGQHPELLCNGKEEAKGVYKNKRRAEMFAVEGERGWNM